MTVSTEASRRLRAEPWAASPAGSSAISQGCTLAATGPVATSVLATSPPPSSATRVRPPGPGARGAAQDGGTDEVGDEGRGGRGGELRRRAALDDASLVDHRRPGRRACAASAKSWVTSSAGTPASRSEAASSRPARARGSGVERGQRLVQQQDARMPRRARERARRAGARPRTAHAGAASARRASPKRVEQLVRPAPALGAREPRARRPRSPTRVRWGNSA